MILKEAIANSLLMFVAATCVVLIVKAMPQTQATVQIAADAKSGTNGPAQRSNDGTPTLAVEDGVKVFYLHGNIRCSTCRTIEEYAQEAIQDGFAEELKSGKIQWQVINFDLPDNKHYTTDYKLAAPNVVLAKFKDGRQVKWKGLPEVWEHVNDKAAFSAFVQTSVSEFIGVPKAAERSPSNPGQSAASLEPSIVPVPE